MRTTLAALLAATLITPVALTPALANKAGDAANFTLDHVTFDGNSRVSTDTLNSVVGLAPGDQVNREKIVAAFDAVQAEYQKENVGGNIAPVMTYPKPGHLNLTFKIAEAAAPAPAKRVPLVLDHETFTGNVKVSSDKLQPALSMKPGDTVTTEQVAADRDALSKVYQSAKVGGSITPQVTYPTQGHVDLNFEIVEGKPRS